MGGFRNPLKDVSVEKMKDAGTQFSRLFSEGGEIDPRNEQLIAEQEEKIRSLINKRPKWASYEVGKFGGTDVLGGLDPRMAKARDIAQRAEIGTGAQYGMAEQDVGRLAGRAWGQGPSASAQAMLEQQRLGELSGRERFQEGMAGQLAQQRAGLAARGGLSGGAGERLARSSGREQMMGMQQMGREGRAARLGITAQDEAQRMALQQQMPGMRMGLEQYQTGLSEREAVREAERQQINQQLAMQKAGLWGQTGLQQRGQDANIWQATQQMQQQEQNLAQQAEQSGWQGMMQAEGALQSSAATQRAGGKQGGMFAPINPGNWFKQS